MQGPAFPAVTEDPTAATWTAPAIKHSLPSEYQLPNNNPNDQNPEARKTLPTDGWRPHLCPGQDTTVCGHDALHTGDKQMTLLH